MKRDDKLDELMADLRRRRLEDSNYEKRDILLSRFHKVWQPLTEHIQSLAAAHLPEGHRLHLKFTVKEDFAVALQFSMEQAFQHDPRENAEPYWGKTDTLAFYKPAGDSTTLALLSNRLTLSDLFLARAGNPYALTCSNFGITDKKLQASHIHPDRMDKAKALLEYWLAKQISLDFDPERLQPVSSLEITMTRKAPSP